MNKCDLRCLVDNNNICDIPVEIAPCCESRIYIVTPSQVHACAVEKGWWKNVRPVPELLCLLHSEISEALEAYRNNIPEGADGCLSEELADLVIRIWDMTEGLGIDIAKAVNEKHKRNLLRPYRHGGKKC
jgi:NTP pyrophosphatase (non-canonical NTP hydrolase)